MRVAEVARELGFSERYIVHHFPDVCRRLEKIGIKLVKCGKGASAEYGIIEGSAVVARFEYKGD